MLAVYPLLLSRGKRLFPDNIDPHTLALVRSQTASSGVLINYYRHVEPPQAA